MEEKRKWPQLHIQEHLIFYMHYINAGDITKK